jgi:AhpD family alkylhydroperoxidase
MGILSLQFATGGYMSNPEAIHQAARSLTKIHRELPEAMAHFSSLASAATSEGVLDAKTKALITLSLAIQSRSAECLAYHVRNAIKQGVTHEELLEITVIAAYMGGGPALMAAEDSLALYEQMEA